MVGTTDRGGEYISTLVARALLENDPGTKDVEDLRRLVQEVEKEVLENRSGALNAFLSDESVGLLAYSYRSDSSLDKAVVGANTIDSVSANSRSLVVVGKLVKQMRQHEDISSQIMLLALEGLKEDSFGSSTSKLYYAVQNAFFPLLGSASEVSSVASSNQILKKVQSFVQNIKIDFTQVFSCDLDVSDVLDKAHLEFASKKAIENEIIHWSKVQSKNEACGVEDASSRKAITTLHQMKQAVDRCAAKPLEAEVGGPESPVYDLELVGDVVETFYDTLDALWLVEQTRGDSSEFLYSKNKMKSLLYSLTCFACTVAIDQLLTESIWVVPFVEIETHLERASRMLTRWEKVVVDLCSFQWKGGSRSFDQAEVTEVGYPQTSSSLHSLKPSKEPINQHPCV